MCDPNWEKLLSNGTHSINGPINTFFISWTIQGITPFNRYGTPKFLTRSSGRRDYWFFFRAMPAEEPTFVPPPAISQQFHGPANQLDETLDPTAIQREDKLILKRSLIDNATGPLPCRQSDFGPNSNNFTENFWKPTTNSKSYKKSEGFFEISPLGRKHFGPSQ